ncbi:MAG: hypothetical protein QF463_12990 [Vicinamibacterales bacterium]|jgi:hypothetical protein|nr:hypothetical protein [Acidobacteriota bacterium]MDP6372905.1 hypothetical protein [Vicinamibacterales bacterium]MDP6609979.1 hypothetical protein [Vicinamibacterales bacterium]HAK56434.1 hypothetical protein [Acidobacteriota bacterium]|tara:strand:- start:5240 stop:5674 length:435 start_codon:yes stop_codon:yes gene_type:complete
MPQGVAATLLTGALAVLAGLGTTTPASAQTDEILGSVELPRQVLANGDRLSAGTYQVRLTDDAAEPEAAGQLSNLSRWVEFVQGDAVAGREVVSIVPADEIGDVAGSAAPGSGDVRIELLRENEYLRIWINQSGTHYLIHLPVG